MSLPSLYVVCDAEACARAGWALADFAAACLDGGATLLQIRGKHLSARDLSTATEAIVRRAGAARIIVNDRADVARISGAAGVHIGQDDLPAATVRALLGRESIVGLSTHTREQIAAAVAEPVTYVAIGPVFGTSTKDTGYAAVGLSLVRDAAMAARTAGLPVVAIGGITLESAADVIAAGASSVAIISDILVSGNPRSRVREYLQRLSQAV